MIAANVVSIPARLMQAIVVVVVVVAGVGYVRIAVAEERLRAGVMMDRMGLVIAVTR